MPALPLRVADLPDGGLDVRVRRTAADVATHELSYGLVCAGVAFLDQRHGGHDLTRRAVAALEGVVLDEGALHGMQLAARGQALDSGDLAALARDGQRKAGQDRPAGYPYRARAAGSLVASLFRAGQVQVITQRVQQADPRLEVRPP